jgi:hypothetical protein
LRASHRLVHTTDCHAAFLVILAAALLYCRRNLERFSDGSRRRAF